MTIDEMIDVLQAAKRGETIQCRRKLGGDSWGDCLPLWSFDVLEYRVKPKPQELWVNEFTGGIRSYHKSRHDADAFKMPGRVRCVRFVEAEEVSDG